MNPQPKPIKQRKERKTWGGLRAKAAKLPTTMYFLEVIENTGLSAIKLGEIGELPTVLIRPPVRGTYSGAVTGIALHKENAIQHSGYMDFVRAMPCAHCGWSARSQFCHADCGKGVGIKTDCRLGWPGCGPHDEGGITVAGCHYLLGGTGAYPKGERRFLEAMYAAQTRAKIIAAGHWPSKLPLWAEKD